MVSGALTVLRGTAQAAADIYNGYPGQRTRIIQDISLAVPSKLNKIWALATAATDKLQTLQDRVNVAEEKIRAAAQPASMDVAEAATSKVRYMFDNGMGVMSVCETLVADNDRAGFNALNADLRMLAKLGKLGYPTTLGLDKMIIEAKATIATQFATLATRDELMVLAEVEEVEVNMSRLRISFRDLFAFFQTQLLPSVIAGQQNRLESVNNWFGLGDLRIAQLRAKGVEWDVLDKSPRILLVSDLDQVGLANLRDSGGPGQQRYDPAAKQYQQVGPNSVTSWRDKPLKGSLS